MSRNEIRIAGAGGQGVVTAGLILAEAAILSGGSATHSQVYGPQSRGGASRSDVVIASGQIGFPLADDIDLLVVLSAAAYTTYRPGLGARGRLVADDTSLSGDADDSPSDRASCFPILEAARSISGGQLAAGVVALGVLHAMCGVVDTDALREAVAGRVPARHRVMNLRALEAGMQMIGEVVR